MRATRYKIFPKIGKVFKDETYNVRIKEGIYTDWKFNLTIEDALRIHGTKPNDLAFVYISNHIPNHNEICETILKIVKETLL